MKYLSFSRVVSTPFLLLFLLGVISAGRLLAADVCSAPLIDDVTHQGARVQWTSATVGSFQRVRYGLTSSYGSQQGTNDAGGGAVLAPYYQGLNLAGLSPNTTYHAVGESSNDNVNWCTGVDATFTTLPLPNPHPAYPIPPAQFDTSTVPTVTGATWTVGGNCPDFQTCLNSATFGDQIVIPAGTTVSPGSAVNSTYQTPAAPDATPVSVSSSNSTFTSASPHGFSSGQAVRISSSYYLATPLRYDTTYYVVNPTSTTFQLSLASNGAPITLSNGGLGTHYVIGWPIANNKYIIIRTSTPDSQLPPPGVRLDPVAYGSKLALIQNNAPASAPPLLGFGPRSHHYWFIGIEFTTGSSTTVGQNTDPQPFVTLLTTNSDTQNVVVDRCWIHGPGFPNRLKSYWTHMDGANIAMINSYVDNQTYWRPFKTGMAATMTSNSLSIAAGVFYLGQRSCTNNGVTVTLTNGGGATGTGYFYYDMNCVLTLNLPTGAVASGAGVTVINSSSPAFPVDVNGNKAAGMLGTLGVSAGVFTSWNDIPAYSYSAYNTEGNDGVQVGFGPGPTKLENNYIEGTGIPVFWTDDLSASSAGLSIVPGDAVIRRNTIGPNLSTIAGSPWSDGRAYAHRNNVEFKVGKRILIEGNIIKNSFAENNKGPALIFNSNASATPAGISPINEVSDMEVRYNTFTNNAEVGLRSAKNPNGSNTAKAAKRIWWHDNLAYGNNGWIAATTPYDGAGSPGYAAGLWSLSYMGVEDQIDEHNTVYDSRGFLSAIWFLGVSIPDGLTIRNNLYWANNDHPAISFIDSLGDAGGTCCGTATLPNYGGYAGSTLMNVMPLFTWDHNVLVGGYAVSGPAGSEVQLAQTDVNNIAATMPGGTQTIWPSGANIANRTASVGWFNATAGNFRLKSTSPHISGGALRGTDGLDIGANIDALEAAQGKVSNVRIYGINSNSATLAFLAPDSFGCSVDWSTNGFSTFTRVANAGGARPQTVSLTSLPGATPISYRINCAVMQPSGTFNTH